MELSEAVLIFLISNLFAGIAILWKFASAWGSLRQADKQNHNDINALGRKTERYDRFTSQRISFIEEFLREQHGYNPPTLNPFEHEK